MNEKNVCWDTAAAHQAGATKGLLRWGLGRVRAVAGVMQTLELGVEVDLLDGEANKGDCGAWLFAR